MVEETNVLLQKISYNRLDIDINNDKPYFLLILWSIFNAVLFATNMRYNTITYAKKKHSNTFSNLKHNRLGR